MAWQPSEVTNDAEREFRTDKPKLGYGKYCEKHTTWDFGSGECSLCKEGAPAFKRSREQVINGTEKGKKEWDRFVKLGWAKDEP